MQNTLNSLFGNSNFQQAAPLPTIARRTAAHRQSQQQHQRKQRLWRRGWRIGAEAAALSPVRPPSTDRLTAAELPPAVSNQEWRQSRALRRHWRNEFSFVQSAEPIAGAGECRCLIPIRTACSSRRASKYEDQVKDIITELDRPVPQVLIKVLIAEVTHDNSDDLGLDFSVLNLRPSGNGQSLVSNLGNAAANTANGGLAVSGSGKESYGYVSLPLATQVPARCALSAVYSCQL